MDDLVIENKALIYFIINKMGLQYDLEELYEAGELALIKASKTFNEDKGCKFSTFAAKCIQREISKHIQYRGCQKRKKDYMLISLDEEKCDNSTLLEIIDSGVNLEEDILKRERIDLLNKIIAILEPNDRYMVEHYYGLGINEKLTYKRIADRLGLKQRYVEYRIKRALRIIKKIMEDKEVI